MDTPEELVITLTFFELQVRDAGRYWCAVDIGGLSKSDIRTSLELQVTDGENCGKKYTESLNKETAEIK